MATTLPYELYTEFLVCTFCFEGFEQPKILPCLHTFCQSCLEKHLSRSTTTTARLWFLCPQCRNITDVPQSGLSGFRTNNFILKLKEIVDSGCEKSKYDEQGNVKTDIRDNDNVSTKGYHKGVLYHQNHATKKNEKRLSFCDCRQREVRFFCDTCRITLCGECMKSAHMHHTIQLLEEHANKDRDLVITAVHDSRTELTSLIEGNNDLEKYKKQLRKARDDATFKVKNQATTTRELIDKIEREMLKDIDEVFCDERNKTDDIIRVDKEVVALLKNFNTFSERLLKDGTDPEIIAWRGHIQEEFKNIAESSMKDSCENTKKNPVDIRYKESPLNLKDTLEKIIGEVQYGRNVDIVDWSMSPRRQMTRLNKKTEDDKRNIELNPDDLRIIKSRIHKGKLLKSFSIFTDGSQFSPRAMNMVLTPSGEVLVVDRGNKCVKFFAKDGGMYKKIYGSDALWGVAMLHDGNLAVTDKTVHMFDLNGKLLKVLRQQPRDSHGIAVNSNGDIVVTDCTSRCIYVMASVGGTIKRIITQRGRQPFRCPQYVTVNHKDDIIVSDGGTHCVSIFNDNGNLLFEYGSGEAGNLDGQLNCPTGVCTDKLGNILICDKLNHRVVLLDPNGTLMCNIVDGREHIEKPQAVAVDTEGNVMVAEEGGRIKMFKYREIK